MAVMATNKRLKTRREGGLTEGQLVLLERHRQIAKPFKISRKRPAGSTSG